MCWIAIALDLVEKSAWYARALRELPGGLSEWAVHPALGTPEMQALEPESWQVRQTDFDFLISRKRADHRAGGDCAAQLQASSEGVARTMVKHHISVNRTG